MASAGQLVLTSFILIAKLLQSYFLALVQMLKPPPPNSFSGQVILVTGGANGIGRALLRHIAILEKQVTLVSWDIDETANNETKQELEALGVERVFALTVDLTSFSEISNAASKTRANVGDITMLYNNAGVIGPTGKCWESSLTGGRNAMEVNLFSHWQILREFIPRMIANKHGYITSICSIAGFVWCPDWAPYVASKHANKGYYECLKEDLRKAGLQKLIKVTIVYPGLVNTGMIAPFGSQGPGASRLLSPLSPDVAAAAVINGVRRNKEYIYIPRYWRFLHGVLCLLPVQFSRDVLDAARFDPHRSEEIKTV